MESGEELFGSVHEKGSVIFRQGDPGDVMYIVQSGAVEAVHAQGDRQTALNIMEKGDFFGEMALFGDEPRSATVIALSRTRLLPLTRDSLLKRVSTDPSVSLRLMQTLIQRIQRLDRGLHETIESDEELRSALGGSPHSDPSPPQAGMKLEYQSKHALPLTDMADIWDSPREARDYATGECIFSEGAPGDTMYIILEGTVEITRGTGGSKWVLNRLGEGQFFGEMAIVTDSPRSASAEATSQVRLMPVRRSEFLARVRERPELALHIIQALAMRLRFLSALLVDPTASIGAIRQAWHPLLQGRTSVKVSIVSLSTCAGCLAVLLDSTVLDKVHEAAEIVYCPMLMDQDEMPEADVALVDGVVRLKEDMENLELARRKNRFIVSWGTCSALGGIPSQANQYELEQLIEESYGESADTYAYYLSGKGGVEWDTYQHKGMALLRKARRIDDFVRVDYHLPGCPPSPDLLLKLLAELTGGEVGKPQPIVCGQCDRKPTKAEVTSLEAFCGPDTGPDCYNSMGIACMGFLTRGGCSAVCTRHGLPCWGCRGPAKPALSKMAGGNSFEEVATAALARTCKLDEGTVKPMVKLMRKQAHTVFDFDRNAINSLSRLR